MQWVIAGVGQPLIGGDREENVGGFHAHFRLVEVVVFQDADVIERGFDHRFGAGLGGFHDFADACGTADIARIDPQAGSARLGGFNRTLIVEVDISDDRYRAGLADFRHCRRRGFVRAGDAHDVGTGIGTGLDLRNGCLGIRCQGVRHGLHRDRCVAADQHVADGDLTGFTSEDVAVGPHAHGIVPLAVLATARWRFRSYSASRCCG